MKVYLIMHIFWENYYSYSGDPEIVQVHSVFLDKDKALAEAERLGDEAMERYREKDGIKPQKIDLKEWGASPGIYAPFGFEVEDVCYDYYMVEQWEVKE